ncbi:MAG: hypothetical protein KDD69_15375 [Bdellovibrionales bacterium]|nr:hypothetical protein [Bdellovibrionales bacterium]
MRVLLLGATLSLTLGLQGCVYGILYTDVTRPLTRNMDVTPNPETKLVGKSRLNRLSEPLSGLDIRVELASNAIGDAAKQAGMQKIYYADLRQQSVLLGIWQRTTVIVYGE